MIHVESRNGEAAEAHGEDEGRDGRRGIPRVSHDHEENGLHPEPPAVEDLADGCGGEDPIPSVMVRQLTPKGHDDRHDQMGEGGQGAHLPDLEVEHLLEVHRLGDDEEVEGPGSAKVGHDDRIHGHGGEETFPRGRPEVGDRPLDVAQGLFDVEPLARRDGWMEAGLLEGEPTPEDVPDESESPCHPIQKDPLSHPIPPPHNYESLEADVIRPRLTVDVERGLPADAVREPSGEWHAHHGPSVGAAKGQGGQAGSFQRGRPPSPDPVTGRVGHPLHDSRISLWRPAEM